MSLAHALALTLIGAAGITAALAVALAGLTDLWREIRAERR